MSARLYTTVDVEPSGFTLDCNTPVVSLGSCFADEMGRRLQEGGFDVELNPFGTLYNPASIADGLSRLMEGRPIDGSDLVRHDGLWHSWCHHGSFSRTDRDECLAVCNRRMAEARTALLKARLLMVTFGTAWVFEHGGRVVANCHKVPAAEFARRRMTVDEVVALWRPLLQRLQEFNPDLRVLFTVSPIRHMADTAHGNQLSKSVLLLSVDALGVDYFPAYEIVLDELRDYRFYASDLVHPSDLAADIVYERFQQCFMTARTIEQARLNAKALRRQRHIPLH